MAMETFADKMKQALESRGMRLEDVARSTGVSIAHLQALGRADRDALPEDARIRECLRALAECIDVSADEVIQDYFAECETRGHARPSTKSRGSLVPIAFALMAILGSAAWWWIRSTGSSAGQPETLAGPAAIVSTEPVPDPVIEANILPADTPVGYESQPIEPAEPLSPTAPSGLIIESHGVGTAVVNRQLVGQADRFVEGSEVWFFTDVQGGTAGETIHHVWLHEGREARSIPLSLGGPRWRTQSGKSLPAGSAGNWTVEARDDAGNVLARQEFLCVTR